MKIAYDAKRYYHNKTGLGNYSRTLVTDMQRFFPDTDAVLYDEKAMARTFRMGRMAAADGCELIHGLSNELPRDIDRCGIPSVVTMHDVAWRTFPDMYSLPDRLIYDWKYGWSARHATHVICISESTKRDVMRFYGVPEERITVIYQPVNERFYTPMDKEVARELCTKALPYLEGKEYILTVGSINSRKNLMGMVKAYNNIPKEERPLFVVVGNGREYRRKVESYIKEQGLEEWIHIETEIHGGDVLHALYTNALCLMYPSFYEGFGLPVVEAALQRCPVITSTVSSLPEAAGPDALLVDPSSVDEITEALRLLLGSKEKREEVGNAVYEYCDSHFRPADLTAQIHALYSQLKK